MKQFLLGLLLIGCLNLITGCDLNILDTPPATVIYDVGLGFYEPCCYTDVVYYYKDKN